MLLKSGAPLRRMMALIAILSGATFEAAVAQKKYDPGATDTEIKIGNIAPYSGPVSAYSAPAKTETAYFAMINAEGGINGRKIKFISYDDAYSPPKAVEQTRKLVEDDEVLLIFNGMGTASNAASQKYLNQKKVPQLFVGTGATRWGDPTNFPWTMGWGPAYATEGRIFAKYLLKEKPEARIAILYQNDDYGKDYLKGFKEGLGSKAASMVVAEEPYDPTEPTIDSRIVRLRASNADTFFDVATGKFAAQAIKKIAELGWKPTHILNNVSASVGAVMKPAGLDNSQGVITSAYLMDQTDPTWKDDSRMKEYVSFMDKHYPNGDKGDALNMYGYNIARTMVQVLKQCGDDLTRENVMKQAANIKGFSSGTLLPGITLETSASDYFPIEQYQLMRFKGDTWELFGEVINGR